MILVVGKHFNGLRQYLADQGIEQMLLLDELVGENHAIKQGCNFVTASFSSRESIESVLEQIPGKVDAVVAIYENYVLPAAWIAEKLKANGLPVKSAEACTDKELMRSLFNKAPKQISPDFRVVNEKQELLDFADKHSYPLVLKPANLAKSLLVTTCNNKDELVDSYESALREINNIYRKHAPHRKPKLIIEEYLKGPVHSVDAFVDGDGKPHILDAIVDYRTGHDIGYHDNFHYSRVLPTSLSKEDQKKFKEAAELGVKALGMKYTAAHIEIIMTEQGPRIVEIGARNGGYRPRMHMLANGINIYQQLINTLTDQPIDITNKKNSGCAVLELFPKVPGEFKELLNEVKLRQLDSFKYLSLKAKPGEHIGLSSQGYKMSAVVILQNDNLNQFKSDLEFVDDNVRVDTR